MSEPKRLIIGLTGATGTIFGIRLLEMLRETDIETHLVMSKWAARTLLHETHYRPADVAALATKVYQPNDQGAAISSGSFITLGLAVVPCSMRTLAAIANGVGDTLIHRAADVILKERRKLVLMVRESPLNDIHLENMLKLSRMGAVIMPPMPAFYNHPRNLDEMINHIVMRTLDQFGLHFATAPRWDGTMSPNGPRPVAGNLTPDSIL